MRIVEIGCGNSPGPFFEGAAEHYAVDQRGLAILEVLMTKPEMTPMVADAADLEFEDESVDTVLARNLFGDIGIGMNNAQRFMSKELLEKLVEEEKFKEFTEAIEAVNEESDSKKIAIIQEAARILVVGGKLIVVEQDTPDIAAGFFQRAKQSNELDLPGTFEFERGVPLAEVTPPNYAEVHEAHPDLQTWVATKK